MKKKLQPLNLPNLLVETLFDPTQTKLEAYLHETKQNTAIVQVVNEDNGLRFCDTSNLVIEGVTYTIDLPLPPVVFEVGEQYISYNAIGYVKDGDDVFVIIFDNKRKHIKIILINKELKTISTTDGSFFLSGDIYGIRSNSKDYKWIIPVMDRLVPVLKFSVY